MFVVIGKLTQRHQSDYYEILIEADVAIQGSRTHNDSTLERPDKVSPRTHRRVTALQSQADDPDINFENCPSWQNPIVTFQIEDSS